MRIYTRYRGPRRSPKSQDRWSWLFALLCLALLGLLGWIWWRFVETDKPPKLVALAPTNAPRPAVAPPPVRATVPPTQAVVAPQSVRGAPAPTQAVITPTAATTTNLVKLEPTNVVKRPPAPPPQPEASAGVRPVQNIFEAQLALSRQGISSGSLDGGLGSQTRAALGAFQRKRGLVPTGALDGDTKALLLVSLPLYTTHTVTEDDLARLRPVPKTWLEKSAQPRLDYETLLELVAEKSFSHPNLIRQLNPDQGWTNVVAGAVLKVPRVEYPPPPARAALVRLSLSNKTLEAFDASSNLLAHFPCSIGKLAEKRPVGELRVAVVAPNPNYTFNPEVFPESAEGRQLGRKLILPPGPNNPVGAAWIGLDRPGYGIHGTPSPELVGRTESHGCFRLANWNAMYLLQLVAVGTPVMVEP